MPETGQGRSGRLWGLLFGVFGAAMAAQICLFFVLPVGRVVWLVGLGWGLFALSAVLGWVPMLVLRSRGGVAKGKSYVHTTRLVTSGPYAFVRHPQFVGADLLAVAVVCITQHWAALLVSAIGIAANRWSMRAADRDLMAKFGQPYREYMARVPRASLLVGSSRWARRRLG